MSDEETPQGLRGWRPIRRRLVARAWARAANRETLEELWAERDPNGERILEQVVDRDPADPTWFVLTLRPVGDPDGPSYPVGTWPESVELDARADVDAIVAEHFPDD